MDLFTHIAEVAFGDGNLVGTGTVTPSQATDNVVDFFQRETERLSLTDKPQLLQPQLSANRFVRAVRA